MTEYFLDCKGMKCPMPIVAVFKKFATLEINDTLIVISDDLAFPHDIEAWCMRMEQNLIEVKTEKTIVTAKLKKIKG